MFWCKNNPLLRQKSHKHFKMQQFVLICLLAVTIVIAEDIKLEPASDGYLFEGDIVMSRKQIDTALKGGDVDKAPANTYGLLKATYKRWPNGVVPYTKNLGFKPLTKRAIRKAMESWEAKTCIRFKERTKEKDYIEFFSAGFGKCYSHVGRTGGKQKISLGFGCFTTGIAIHEIGHALGMYHEQSRPDRDDYVEILWDNIKADNKFNFNKYTHHRIDSLGSPYDYDSIMHYEWNAFSKIPFFQRTIRAKKSGASFGQRSHISVQDAAQINKYYECKM